MAPHIADALRAQILKPLVEFFAAQAEGLQVSAVTQRDDAVANMAEKLRIGVHRLIQRASVVRHVARAVGRAADEIYRIRGVNLVKHADVERVHQMHFNIVNQIGAIHLNRLGHIVCRAGHGADKYFEFHSKGSKKVAK